MKRFTAVLALAGAVLILAAAAGAAPIVGVAEDATKYAPDGGAALYETMKANGLTSNRISVFWDFNNPTTIEEKDELDRVVPIARAAGVQLVFALYADPRIPGGARAIAKDPDAFCSFASEIAQAYPTVTKIIVGNEPNQPRFWQPQFSAAGKGVAGARFEVVLARCYDALKAVNPAIDVIGVGLSPRGNDKPHAKSNVSRSPVGFLHDLGVAYRASGRQLPLMDEFAFHCYPNVNTDAVSRGYPWPNVGCVNLDRLKQALWDAFNGTAQPAPAEGVPVLESTTDGALDYLPLMIDETGWQVNVKGETGYNGAENVPTVTEKAQARYYGQLVGVAACDPAITAFHFLYLFDSPDLADFQSGMEDVAGNPRDSAGSVKSAIERGCTEGIVSWRHRSSVAGGHVARHLTRGRRAILALTAREAYSYEVVFSSDADARVEAKAERRTAGTATVVGTGKANLKTEVVVPPGVAGGTATVTLTAWANPDRTETFTLNL